MRMIRCNKCGTMVASSDTALERMMDEAREERKLAKKEEIEGNRLLLSAKNRRENAKQLDKLANQIRHRYCQIEERKTTLVSEMGEICHYILTNDLITPEKLDELRAKARADAKIKNEADEREIEALYKDYSGYTGNRTKPDPTYKEGTKNV